MWIPFTGLAGRILQSPAHHQIHHSDNPAHWDKNLGFALAVWDWAFGTLYIPERRARADPFRRRPDRGRVQHRAAQLSACRSCVSASMSGAGFAVSRRRRGRRARLARLNCGASSSDGDGRRRSRIRSPRSRWGRRMAQDKFALVTGGGRGIGRAAALALAAAGWHVAVAGRSAPPLAQVAREIERLGRRALAHACDVVDPASVDGAVRGGRARLRPARPAVQQRRRRRAGGRRSKS